MRKKFCNTSIWQEVIMKDHHTTHQNQDIKDCDNRIQIPFPFIKPSDNKPKEHDCRNCQYPNNRAPMKINHYPTHNDKSSKEIT